MSRTLADLTAGTLIYVDETVSGETKHVPYIYLGIDDNGNGRLLRQYAPMVKRMNATNVASYAGCEMDVWLENDTDGFLSRFDAATLNALVQTAIKYVDYTQSADGTAQVLQISRRCFLLSYSEEGYGNDPAGNEGSSFLPALKAFTGLTNDNQARITYSETNGQTVGAWMRSAGSAAFFRSVYASGVAFNYDASNASVWPRPALSVAPATLVSDEGADVIFLLPDGRRTTWNVDVAFSLGESTERPSEAKVELGESGITASTIDVCNNYGDAAPAWVRCDETGYAELPNETKETADWNIGIRISAEGNTPESYIGEPIVTIAVEQEE